MAPPGRSPFIGYSEESGGEYKLFAHAISIRLKLAAPSGVGVDSDVDIGRDALVAAGGGDRSNGFELFRLEKGRDLKSDFAEDVRVMA